MGYGAILAAVLSEIMLESSTTEKIIKLAEEVPSGTGYCIDFHSINSSTAVRRLS